MVFSINPVCLISGCCCFRMGFFQRQGVLLSHSQLLAQISSHYTQQALQQAYVLILGLDVLGNPYGLVRDFTQGLGDFFYEPFMVKLHTNFTKTFFTKVKSVVRLYFYFLLIKRVHVLQTVEYFAKLFWL